MINGARQITAAIDGADGRTRTGTGISPRGILSPLRLPFRHVRGTDSHGVRGRHQQAYGGDTERADATRLLPRAPRPRKFQRIGVARQQPAAPHQSPRYREDGSGRTPAHGSDGPFFSLIFGSAA